MLKDNSHVFIVGLPRTGTSIMYRTVQKLPNFRSKKLNLCETTIFKDKIAFNTPDLYYPGLLKYLYKEKEIYDSFLKSIKKFTDKLKGRDGDKNSNYGIKIKYGESLVDKLKLTIRNKLIELKWKQSCRNKIIREYFKFAKKSRQSKRIVEKTPYHYMHVHQIVWTFPNARIIWMIRHPIDIITSSIKRAKIDKNYLSHWNIDNFIKEFRNSFRRHDFYKHLFKRNIILIKYEDFVNDPTGELKKICTFIDEPFSCDSLTIREDERIKWKPDSHLFSKIVDKTEKNWRDHLSLEDAEKIEIALHDLMEKYNFNFYSKNESEVLSI